MITRLRQDMIEPSCFHSSESINAQLIKDFHHNHIGRSHKVMEVPSISEGLTFPTGYNSSSITTCMPALENDQFIALRSSVRSWQTRYRVKVLSSSIHVVGSTSVVDRCRGGKLKQRHQKYSGCKSAQLNTVHNPSRRCARTSTQRSSKMYTKVQ